MRKAVSKAKKRMHLERLAAAKSELMARQHMLAHGPLDYQWVASPSLKVRRMLRKEGWRQKRGYGGGYDKKTGIVMMYRPVAKPPKATRKDIEALRDYLSKWLSEHR